MDMRRLQVIISFGQTNIDENGSAQKYGKEYSPKSGDKFVLSVAKGETVVLTKEIKKSFKYKIESGGST